MYYFVYGSLYLFSLIPLRLLYLVSDLIAFLLYYVFRYRRGVVLSNLQQAFPEKDSAELNSIAKKFYRNFIDNWVETIKLLSISQKALRRRISGNFDVLHQLHASGKSVQATFGHFFNWEIMTLYTGISQPYTFLTVYLPQNNKLMNRLILHIRGRWGNPLLSSLDMARAIIPWRKKQYMLALGADQRPVTPGNAYWLYFLNRPAGFVKGPEKFSRGQGLPVVIMTTTRKKRGCYHFDYFLLCEDPAKMPEGELIRQYVRHLEANIRLQPDLYLWSHKRWKHPWKEEYRNLWVDDKPVPGEEKGR